MTTLAGHAHAMQLAGLPGLNSERPMTNCERFASASLLEGARIELKQ